MKWLIQLCEPKDLSSCLTDILDEADANLGTDMTNFNHVYRIVETVKLRHLVLILEKLGQYW